MDDNMAGLWTEMVSVQLLDEQQKWACLSGLPVGLKHKAWAEINANNPALAKLLRDPGLHELVAYFDAQIFVESELVPSLPTEPLKGRGRPSLERHLK